MLAAQGILTYGTTPTLPYHLYADEWELLVLPAPLTSVANQLENPGGFTGVPAKALGPGLDIEKYIFAALVVPKS